MKYHCFPRAGGKIVLPPTPCITQQPSILEHPTLSKREPVPAKRRQSNVASFPHCPGQIDEIVFWPFQMPGAIWGQFNPVRDYVPQHNFKALSSLGHALGGLV